MIKKSQKNEKPKIRTSQSYGWVPDIPDHRDLLFTARTALLRKLPSRANLSPQCSPVENQLKLGSCTANALVGALEFLMLKEKRDLADLSRLFLYYNERVIMGTEKQDSGASLRDGVKTLNKQGVCLEESWPYQPTNFALKPSAKCYREAQQEKITAYYSIRSLDEARACLADGYPFVFGFAVYSSFESLAVKKSGVLDYPSPLESMVGGHAVLAVGYHDNAKRFIVRNSWGQEWGQAGYFTMPYEYLFGDRRPALASDFWTIRETVL